MFSSRSLTQVRKVANYGRFLQKLGLLPTFSDYTVNSNVTYGLQLYTVMELTLQFGDLRFPNFLAILWMMDGLQI